MVTLIWLITGYVDYVSVVCVNLCSLILTFPEGVKMLRDAGVEMGDEEDLT